jgi:hypothetical protein
VAADDETRAAEEPRREARYRMGVAGSTVPDGVEDQMPMRGLGFVVKVGFLGFLGAEGVRGAITTGAAAYWVLLGVSILMLAIVLRRSRPLKDLFHTAPRDPADTA